MTTRSGEAGAFAGPAPQLADRGAGKLAPENTLTAMRRAMRTATGWSSSTSSFRPQVAFLLHDKTLDRTTSAAAAPTR